MDSTGEKLDRSGRKRGTRIPAPVNVGTHLPRVSADLVGSHFAALRWSLNSAMAQGHIHLVTLTGGAAKIVVSDGREIALEAPALAWLPTGCAEHLDLTAGSTARFLRIKADVGHRYLQPIAEAAYLELLEAKAPLVFPVHLEVAFTIARSISSIAAELAQPAGLGAASIISCELTLCILRCRRLLPAPVDVERVGTYMDVLRRFRSLVDERFHEHLPVSAYADLLGVTADRLHAICTRALKRSPRELIQQRIIHEGAVRLETSGATLKQIAFALGFKDTAYFNRFFKKHTGKPPGAWRRSLAKGGASASSKPLLNFADWP